MTNNSIDLTEEQIKIIYHPEGFHARVLAVAGSGKTTTMVHRVKYLIEECNIRPNAIAILMFNRRARVDFNNKLEKYIEETKRPIAHTFHSFSLQYIEQAIVKGKYPLYKDLWIEDKIELQNIFLLRAIKNLMKKENITNHNLEISEISECISLWKGSLIPPERAGHRKNPLIPLVYAEFERLRCIETALTYDDFVPIAVHLLSQDSSFIQGETPFEFIIADEYQDVNYGQQRLIELLAGNSAEIMLVGDDDQTIYEWRGARPEYILERYDKEFNSKPFITYNLSSSFRFGPFIAQCAENVISHNENREKKGLLAYFQNKPAEIFFYSNESEQIHDVNLELANQIQIIKEKTSDIKNIVALVRTFVQLTGLEIALLKKKIPYRVIGRGPFFDRKEILTLIHYIIVGRDYCKPITKNLTEKILSISNFPNRFLNRDFLERGLHTAMVKGSSTEEFFKDLSHPVKSPFTKNQRSKIKDLSDLLERVNELFDYPEIKSINLLDLIIEYTNYKEYFIDYYGEGETSYDRIGAINAFIEYTETLDLPPNDFILYIASLDSTQGAPLDQQIVLTTVYRVKGEEFDYVFIPDCNEGNMPCLYPLEWMIYDKAGVVQEPKTSTPIENERRLFYVAITRTKKALHIGYSTTPKKGNQVNSYISEKSRFIDEMSIEKQNMEIISF